MALHLRILILSIIFQYCTPVKSGAQYWYKKYGNPSVGASLCDIETYDKGFCITSVNFKQLSGIIFKTDINGNILWQRIIRNLDDSATVAGICATNDGGLAITGEIAQNGGDTILDIYLLKLNPCGNKEWCKIYKVNDRAGIAQEIQQLKDLSYVFEFYLGNQTTEYQCGVFKVDQTGIPVKEVYSLMTPENMMVDSSENAIVTGNEVLPPGWLHSDILKTDVNGDKVFEAPYNITRNVSTGGIATQHTPDGGYITVAGAVIPKTRAFYMHLYKSDSIGNGLWDMRIPGDTTKDEYALDMCRASDSTYIIAAQQSDTVQVNNGLQFLLEKVDDKGNLLKRVLYNTTFQPWKINNTSDGKFIISGQEENANGSPIVAIKINSDLGIDSEYHVNYRYDSLCTQGLKKTDTISIKGSDTIHIDIPKHTTGISTVINNQPNLHIYPNPATDHVFINASGLRTGVVNCAFFNIMGQKIFSKELQANPSGNLQEDMDIRGFAKGVYFIELVQGDKRLVQKVVVE